MNLRNALQAAEQIAKESGESCYIIKSEIYARSDDEFTDGPYVVGTQAACAVVYRPIKQNGKELPELRSVVGVVGADGSHYFHAHAEAIEWFKMQSVGA